MPPQDCPPETTHPPASTLLVSLLPAASSSYTPETSWKGAEHSSVNEEGERRASLVGRKKDILKEPELRDRAGCRVDISPLRRVWREHV